MPVNMFCFRLVVYSQLTNVQSIKSEAAVTTRPFHINRAFVLTYDFAGAECRRQIADNFANVQTASIRS